MNRALVLALVAILSGCAIHEPRTDIRPEVELRESFLDTGIPTSDRWWTELGDPGLEEAVTTALARNPTLHSAWARLDQARAAARIAGAPLHPSVEMALGAQRTRLGASDVPDDTLDDLFVGLTIGYQLDLWNRLGSLRDAAGVDQLVSRKDAEATALALVGTTGEVWYDIAAERSTLELLGEQIAVGEEILDLVQLRFKNGLATAVDVYQQRGQVEAVRNRIPAATTRLAVRRHQLAVLLGREPRAETPLPGGALPDLPPLPATGVPLEVLRARPDVMAAELAVLAADHRLAAAIADRYPTLGITASVGGRAERVSDVLDDWFANLAGNLLAPLLDGGRRAAEADRSRAVVEERLLAWQSALLRACAEVEDALVTERGLRETLRILKHQLTLAEAGMERSESLYANGLVDYLSVLTALQSLQELERREIGVRSELLRNRIRLHLALGGSWSQSLEAPAPGMESES